MDVPKSLSYNGSPVKTAFIKQQFDIFGPWSGAKWSDTSPLALFDVWPSKAVYWELTCMLQADWYIIAQSNGSDYTMDAVERHPERVACMRKYVKNLTAVEDIPLDDYDLVITFDAILNPSRDRAAVFAYYAEENWDRLYRRSLRRPAKGYDLFLAHMMDGPAALKSLPQAVSFPYLHDPSVARSVFPVQKDDSVWIDWRTVQALAGLGRGDTWNDEAESQASRLPDTLGLPVRYRGKQFGQTYGFADPPNWGDAAEYLKQLARCRYYVGVGRIGGAGQGLAEAASLGCLCIGQPDKEYHRLLCHPECLCRDLEEMPRRLKVLAESKSLQADVLAWQDAALDKHFFRGPLNLLHEAIRMKSAGPVSARQRIANWIWGGP